MACKGKQRGALVSEKRSNSRTAALEALLSWSKGQGYLQELLRISTVNLDVRDRALAWELAFGVCRNQRRLQATLDSFHDASRPLKPTTSWIVLLGFYQLHFLDRIPAHAAVHATVELARSKQGEGAAKFVNALLQRFIREGLAPLSSDPVQGFAVEYSLPEWLVAKWLSHLAGDRNALRSHLAAMRQVPAQWLRVNLQKATRDAVQQELQLPENRTWGTRWIEAGASVGAVLRSKAFLEGRVSVQNPAADLIMDLLELRPQLRVWDACAAPGGKTALLLEREPTLQVLASDSDSKRLEQMLDLKTRLALPDFEMQTMDLQTPQILPEFDRILLDVPCSNLGVLPRRPEVASRLTKKGLQQLVQKQEQILHHASQHLRKQGILVYATCSPEPEETTQVIDRFLHTHPDFVLESANGFVDNEFVKNDCVFAGQSELGFDGFFAARLRKRDA